MPQRDLDEWERLANLVYVASGLRITQFQAHSFFPPPQPGRPAVPDFLKMHAAGNRVATTVLMPAFDALSTQGWLKAGRHLAASHGMGWSGFHSYLQLSHLPHFLPSLFLIPSYLQACSLLLGGCR